MSVAVETDRTHKGKVLRCAVMNSSVPGERLRSVRNPPQGLLGWLDSTQRRLTQKVLPPTNAGHVRGSEIAIDYLLEALIKEAEHTEYAFIVPPDKVEELTLRRSQDQSLSRSRIQSIWPASVISRSGLARLEPDLWLDVKGKHHFCFALRNFLSQRIYATMTVLHAVSGLSDQFDVYLRSLLVPHYACDSLICTSKACRDAVQNIYDQLSESMNASHGLTLPFRGRLDVIPLCVDTDNLRALPKEPARQRRGIPLKAIVFLYLGYISPVKADLVPLLTNFARLVGQHQEQTLRLIIAGTGPVSYGDSLQEVVEQLRLAKHVTTLRAISDSVKLELLSLSDVFVSPCDTLQESFGLTPVEAMAAGLPQIVSDWSGYRETVQHGSTGFLIPTIWSGCDSELAFTNEMFGWFYDHIVQGQAVALDNAALYSAMRELVTNAQLRLTMSQASRRRAEEMYSYKAIARRYDELGAELHDVAKSITYTPSVDPLDGPKYFRQFGHFSSRHLQLDDRVNVSEHIAISPDRILSYLHRELYGAPYLTPVLLSMIIDLIRRTTYGCTVRSLLSGLPTPRESDERVIMHVLFLLKHQCIHLLPCSEDQLGCAASLCEAPQKMC